MDTFQFNKFKILPIEEKAEILFSIGELVKEIKYPLHSRSIYRLYGTSIEVVKNNEGEVLFITSGQKDKDGSIRFIKTFDDVKRLPANEILKLLDNDKFAGLIGENDEGEVYMLFNYYVVLPFNANKDKSKLILYKTKPPAPREDLY